MNNRPLFVVVTVACLAFGPSRTSQGRTIIFESFGGSSADPLNGTMTEAGARTWAAATEWRADGSKSVNGSANAWVPFTPEPDNVYTLSLEMNPDISGSSDWFALGFSASNDTGNSFHPAPNNTVGWILNREDDSSSSAFQTFLGPSTAVSANHDPSPDLVGPVDVDIVLDTNPNSPSDWTVEWFADGTSLRGPEALGFNPTINFVGFGGFNSATGFVDTFTLSDTRPVPEPSMLPFAAASILPLIRRRGRKIQSGRRSRRGGCR